MNILIIEDEPQTANVLVDIIRQVQPQSRILGILESIEQSVRYFSGECTSPDLIFMDIQLADGLCFEIFTRVHINSPVVFCTAYDQYTLQAFKTNGVDYILKPVKEEDVKMTFAKIDRLKYAFRPELDILSLLNSALNEKKKFKASILVRFRESYIPVTITNIAVFKLENEILFACTFDNSKYPVFKTITEIESEIDPDRFYRINRQIIINRTAIKEIQPYFNRKVVIKPNITFDEQLIVSRLKVSDFLHWVEQP